MRRCLSRPAVVVTAVAMLAVTACTGDDDPSATGEDGETAEVDEDGEVVCSRSTVEVGAADLVGEDPTAVTRGLADATNACAEAVVVAAGDDAALAAIAAPLAASLDAPLLLDDGTEDLDATVTSLARDGDDPEVVRVGDAAAGDADEGGEETEDATRDHVEVALEVADDLDTDTLLLVDPANAGDLTAAATVAARSGVAVVPVREDADVTAALDGAGDRAVTTIGAVGGALPDDVDATAVDDPWASDGSGDTVWLVDPTDAAGPAVAAAAARAGHVVAPVDGSDLRRGRAEVRRVRDAVDAGAEAVLVGGVADPDQLPLLLEAPEVPGGGLVHLDETRMVALYGQPGAPSLGALGEQDLDATIERAREVSEGYDADGRDVIPTLEVIVTVASVDEQDDGSYSSVTPPEEFEELVEQAAEEDVQVVLDLQPGRTDFLTQARIYEDLLREPHVGLALDPEWRLEDDQVHLEQIGGVDAAEVQEVVDWYAELTRDEGLAESLLVLHQFRLDMLRDRDTVEIPPEVAAVVHADGQGPQSMKLETWQVMTEGAGDQWLWGWKNFYDEDPVVATPDEVLDLDPNVVFVTYQ